MKATYKCLLENESGGVFSVRFCWKKGGHLVWAHKKNEVFFRVDSENGGHSVCKMQFQAKICKFYVKGGYAHSNMHIFHF